MHFFFLLCKGEFCTRNTYRRIVSEEEPSPPGVRVFKYKELAKATKDFSPYARIGEAEFGEIYRGIVKSLANKHEMINIAIKEFNGTWLEAKDDQEWAREVDLLASVSHFNLVRVLGHGAKKDKKGKGTVKRFLVSEYTGNCSVRDALAVRSWSPLPWLARLKVAQDAARGMAFLHEQLKVQLVFRCFKSSVVLLDEEWNAKLADWGLAQLGPWSSSTNGPLAFVEAERGWCLRGNELRGFMGYAAPEFFETFCLTWMGNVWSFGVFLYELITGRPAFDENGPENKRRLVDCVWPCHSNLDQFRQILDPRLKGRYCLVTAHRLAHIARLCLVEDPEMRPRMSQVLAMINEIVEPMHI